MANVVGFTVGAIVMAALIFAYGLVMAVAVPLGVPVSVVFDRLRHTPIPVMILHSGRSCPH
jgi:hypothetical protein